MAATIDATVGGASANSFVTEAEFASYMDTRLADSGYTAATEDERVRALIEATRELSALRWCGLRVDDTKYLSWPRQWAPDPDDPYSDYFDTTEIPERVKRATHELALAFLKANADGDDVAALDEDLQIQSRAIGGAITTQYVDPWARIRNLDRYPAVMREIRSLLDGSSSLNARVVRG